MVVLKTDHNTGRLVLHNQVLPLEVAADLIGNHDAAYFTVIRPLGSALAVGFSQVADRHEFFLTRSCVAAGARHIHIDTRRPDE